MEILIALVVTFGLLIFLDVAAFKWGIDKRSTGWLDGSYDPRSDWHSAQDIPEPKIDNRNNKLINQTGELIILWQKKTNCSD